MAIVKAVRFMLSIYNFLFLRSEIETHARAGYISVMSVYFRREKREISPEF